MNALNLSFKMTLAAMMLVFSLMFVASLVNAHGSPVTLHQVLELAASF